MGHGSCLRARVALCLAGAMALSACTNGFSIDLRNLGGAQSTTGPARTVSAPRPKPDSRGVISYTSYQVAVARPGDTLKILAARVGLPASEIATFNGLPVDYSPHPGEILALPRKVASSAKSTGVDIASIASEAINRAGPDTRSTPANAGNTQTPAPGIDPVRHKVEPGETAYSIARLYNVSPRALADWNGLGPELNVRVGQYLLIPIAATPPSGTAKVATSALPGQPNPIAAPPSASKPLPPATAPVAAPAAENLGKLRTGAGGAKGKLLWPVKGKILRPYRKNRNEGIDIAARSGTSVRAAAAGQVAAITNDPENVPILVLRQSGNLLSVYANLAKVLVKKNQWVKRGQIIATVGKGNPPFLHFELRRGFQSVDPTPLLE